MDGGLNNMNLPSVSISRESEKKGTLLQQKIVDMKVYI